MPGDPRALTPCTGCPNPMACSKSDICAHEVMQEMAEHDSDPWCEECHNLGEIPCLCGGDLCICMNYGSIPCPVCHG